MHHLRKEVYRQAVGRTGWGNVMVPSVIEWRRFCLFHDLDERTKAVWRQEAGRARCKAMCIPESLIFFATLASVYRQPIAVYILPLLHTIHILHLCSEHIDTAPTAPIAPIVHDVHTGGE